MSDGARAVDSGTTDPGGRSRAAALVDVVVIAALDALDELRRRPRHLLLGSLVAGLLAAPLAPRFILLIAVTAGLLAGRSGLALAAGLAVLAGALGGQARPAALDRSELGSLFDSEGGAAVTLLEQPRPVQYGSTALAQLHGWETGAVAAVSADAGERSTGADRFRVAMGDPNPVSLASAVSAGEAPNQSAEREAALVGAQSLQLPGTGERVMLRIREATVWPEVATGGIVRVGGRLRELGPFEQHYARKGASAAITVDVATATGARRGGAGGVVDTIRGRAERALSVGLQPAQAALLRGMVLGQDEALDERTKDEFRISGLAHILAASGQNVALLLALALPLFTLLGLGLTARLAACLVLIALYVPLAGAGPSIQRAGVMGAATTVAALAGRPASRWYALLLAAAVTLVWNPRASGDPGWQLSFAAVVAIALMTPAISARLRRRRVPGPVADAAAMSFAATLGTAPLIAFLFEQFSVVSLAANMLAAPAIAPVMWLGMLAAALGQVETSLALPLNALNAYLLAYVEAVAHQAASVPNAEIRVALGGPLVLAAIYLGVGVVAALLRRRAPGR